MHVDPKVNRGTCRRLDEALDGGLKKQERRKEGKKDERGRVR